MDGREKRGARRGYGMTAVYLFLGIIIPYAALFIFIVGLIYRILKWARAPVPFRIPTTCGQQKSLPWIKAKKLENPYNTAGVIGRMALEVLVFRSLLRNTKTELKQGIRRLVYKESKLLWLGALVFHWSLLIILLRHLRLLTEPVPSFVLFIQKFDGFFQITVPALFLTDILILIALTYLLLRRVASSQLRYISLPSDYLAVFLLLSVAISGILMRFFFRVDLVSVKELALGVLSFHPSIPADGIGLPFYVHLFLVCALFAYLPFSKLVHMAGVFLSPTRNLANNNRMRRHINPWDYPVNVHTYEEWEDEFRGHMKEAGLPLEKE
ncbi:MAG: menaquinol oxidoreductase [Chloroflexi bacterium RBG_13_52_14]|nr:MAG: menaquinol oxidoreductase [Chloroflexi bacterium RBG_13_52_14]